MAAPFNQILIPTPYSAENVDLNVHQGNSAY